MEYANGPFERKKYEWSAPADPKQCVEDVLTLLAASDARPTCTERPLNYTQLQLEVNSAMAYDYECIAHGKYYSDAFAAIQRHMESRFKLDSVSVQYVRACKDLQLASAALVTTILDAAASSGAQ